ncbi:nitrous oxide reductase accessory protein NosL [Paenibacillus sp. OAS669]|uniref:nitrous oxide reductase accessory protein NosL n=1 Tax=Paenibacillus sp. OAS669 TaxID=2663821 RepID=UPI00178BBC8A|nr:nitrous oxide reductase accessory protein NosL [Paenibacillus sp. OAS669]MBE1445769.1 copper chaperone NosL [Paenibacillus sp. OAS669]
MKKSFWLLISLMMMLVLLSGCGKESYSAVPINEATDKCAICNMQVKDDAFAVQLTTKEGKNYKFDDIGCMNEWVGKNGIETVGAEFVRDYNTKEWIAYNTASYVYDATFKTPMAYGIYSFKDKQSAQKFIDEQKKGKLMTSADLKNHTWERAKGTMDMGGHSHDSNSHSESENSMKMDTNNKGMH